MSFHPQRAFSLGVKFHRSLLAQIPKYTSFTPQKLHRHCFRLLLGHFPVPEEIANNGYAKVLGGNRGVL